jgi:ATP-dependent Clp endopeptidase proteolytic subunit ClpP
MTGLGHRGVVPWSGSVDGARHRWIVRESGQPMYAVPPPRPEPYVAHVPGQRQPLPQPDNVLPALGEPPVDGEALRLWVEDYRDRLSLQRAHADLRKAVADAERAEIELAEARRRDADAQAEPARRLVYTFYAEVDEESVRTAMNTLAAWSRREPGAPITVILNSPGGRVLDGLALYDFLQHLRSVGHYLRIEVLGRAASMGGVLLQAGDERVIGANAFLLVHEVSGGAEGKSSEITDRVEFYELMEKKLLAILAERSTLTERQIKTKWNRKDWWLTADEAVALGLADTVL